MNRTLSAGSFWLRENYQMISSYLIKFRFHVLAFHRWPCGNFRQKAAGTVEWCTFACTCTKCQIFTGKWTSIFSSCPFNGKLGFHVVVKLPFGFSIIFIMCVSGLFEHFLFVHILLAPEIEPWCLRTEDDSTTASSGQEQFDSLWLFTYETLITFRSHVLKTIEMLFVLLLFDTKTPFMNSILHFQSIFHIFISH